MSDQVSAGPALSSQTPLDPQPDASAAEPTQSPKAGTLTQVYEIERTVKHIQDGHFERVSQDLRYCDLPIKACLPSSRPALDWLAIPRFTFT